MKYRRNKGYVKGLSQTRGVSYEKSHKSFRNWWVWQRRKLMHLMRIARTKI